ncbi:MAG: class I SAM-dependent methyltransferase [Elusimicrobia bacterium]|nr:class I SAM-dependent methyltransferase [Elusimicrobiota bacterium]
MGKPKSPSFFRWLFREAAKTAKSLGAMIRTDPVIPLLVVREMVGRSVVARVPEPALVMKEENSIHSYAAETEGATQFRGVHLFNARVISHAIQGRRNVLDLGCGPGVLLSLVAELNPTVEFVGVDLSDSMLALAERECRQGLRPNLRFIKGDMTHLENIPSGSFDAVTSSVALHHLPDFSALDKCFAEIRRVLRPGGALCLIDLGRLKSSRTMNLLAQTVEQGSSPIFVKDYYDSLCASFRREEWAPRVGRVFPPTVHIYTAGSLPILHVITTALLPLSGPTHSLFDKRFLALAPKSRAAFRVVHDLLERGGMVLPV